MCRAPVGGMPNARAAATTCWRGSAAMRNRRAVTTPSDLDAFAHDHMFLGAAHDANARRTRWVVLLTAVMMVGEIAAGYVTGSMALLADGFHMATHAGALSIAALAYAYARRHARNPDYSFGKIGRAHV